MKITTAQAARLLGTTPFSITKGLEYKTLDIGWYTRLKGSTRGSVHIVPERLAAYLGISMEELERKLSPTR